MSTKIYNAFRVKQGTDVWPFLWRLRDTAQKNAQEFLKKHYVDLVRRMDPADEDYQKALAHRTDSPEWSHRLKVARARVREGFRTNVTRMERDLYSLEVTVAVYPHKGRYYLRTFCESSSVLGLSLDFVENLPELEDYHYQNQTDRPEEVSAQDWRTRKRIWDEITDAYRDIGSHVTLGIFEWSSFHFLDPWLELASEWRDNPPELPSREEIWAEDLRAVKALRKEKITFVPGTTIQCAKFLILKQEDHWLATLGKRKPRKFPTLNRAANHVWCEFQPEHTKEWVRRMAREGKERRRAERAAKQKRV